MSDSIKTSERPTRTEFDALLTAYDGARAHLRWARENEGPAAYAAAARAAEDARTAVINAATALCPGCGMELK